MHHLAQIMCSWPRHSLVQAAWTELLADFSIAAKRIHKKLIKTAAQE